MSKYIKPETKGWAGIENNNQAPEWPAAVTTHPLANAHISWEQSFHGGAWNE